jgi:hypothetical protein
LRSPWSHRVCVDLPLTSGIGIWSLIVCFGVFALSLSIAHFHARFGEDLCFRSYEVTFHHWVGIAESYLSLNNTPANRKVNTAVQRLDAGPVKT